MLPSALHLLQHDKQVRKGEVNVGARVYVHIYACMHACIYIYIYGCGCGCALMW